MQYTLFATLASLAGLAPFAFVAAAPASGLSARDLRAKVGVHFPPNTKYVNPNDGADWMTGPGVYEFRFGTEVFERLASNESLSRSFTWVIYDQDRETGLHDLEDAYRIWEMKCAVRVDKSLNGAAFFQLSVVPPYVKPIGHDAPASTVSVYCSEGTCVRPDGNCDAFPKPSWEDPALK